MINVKINKGKQNKIIKSKLRTWSIPYMDEQAFENGYDNLLDLRVGDEDDTLEEKAEAKAGRVFRKAVRVVVKQVEKDVADSTRPMPTQEEFLAELPVLDLS